MSSLAPDKSTVASQIFTRRAYHTKHSSSSPPRLSYIFQHAFPLTFLQKQIKEYYILYSYSISLVRLKACISHPTLSTTTRLATQTSLSICSQPAPQLLSHPSLHQVTRRSFHIRSSADTQTHSTSPLAARPIKQVHALPPSPGLRWYLKFPDG